jgi:hypothetical protein
MDLVCPIKTRLETIDMRRSWLQTVRLLSGRKLLAFDGLRMPDFDAATALAWRDADEPKLVIFVSHRWRDISHPDPDGRSLRAICQLISSLALLARGLDPQDMTPVPSLRPPAMLHASVLLSRMLERCELNGRQILDRIAIFFDYSCLPQGHTTQQRDLLKHGLASLPSMVPDQTVTLVALREPNDAYGNRAWCVAESVLSLQYDSARPWTSTFPLRLNLDGNMPDFTFEPLNAAITKWEERVVGRRHIPETEFHDWLNIVVLFINWHQQRRDESGKILHHSPESAERSFMLWVSITIRLAEVGANALDLEPLVREVASSSGLLCTNPEDLLPSSLLILAGLRWEELNRNSGEPTVLAERARDFWVLCLQRFLQGHPLRVQVRPRLSQVPGSLVFPDLRLIEH